MIYFLRLSLLLLETRLVFASFQSIVYLLKFILETDKKSPYKQFLLSRWVTQKVFVLNLALSFKNNILTIMHLKNQLQGKFLNQDFANTYSCWMLELYLKRKWK